MSLRPEPSILGPGTRPALIASRSATSPLIPECPRLRTVVTPLSRSSRANCAPSNTRLLVDSLIASNSPGAKIPFKWRALSASGGHNHVEEQVGVTVNQPGQQGGAAQIDGLDAGRR